MALFRVRPPMKPARNSMVQPMIWPMMMAARPLPKPKGARYVPVRISAMETPAPNQISPFSKTEVRFSSMSFRLLCVYAVEIEGVVHRTAAFPQIQHGAEGAGNIVFGFPYRF